MFLFSSHSQSPKQESLEYIIGHIPQDFTFPYDPQLTPMYAKYIGYDMLEIMIIENLFFKRNNEESISTFTYLDNLLNSRMEL